ncbi:MULTISPECIES: hypothetical protein [unclassified Bartonella]|uniref:hypothetical protein n=1 Tax=unclassified Bartonella TaxID=2645622 RepID=UPI00235DC45F|nr:MULTISPECIES: hypothetical protein [unclassified Bartonella]
MIIGDNAQIYDNACVNERAHITDDAPIDDSAKISGAVRICNKSFVYLIMPLFVATVSGYSYTHSAISYNS